MNSIHKQLLAIVGYQLFGGEKPTIHEEELPDVLKEAKAQTVFTTVFSHLQEKRKMFSPQDFLRCQESFYGNVTINTNNFMEHAELHKLMTERGIPYVTIKGLASAYYYPDPSMRDMGDVDFLVYEKNFDRAKQAVLSAGFAVDHGGNDDDIHIAFTREPLSIWEQHRCVNGIPNGLLGELIRKEADRTIETSELIELDGAVCRIPDKLHHGLIMLLHMVSHLTSEGIGLRHLCDWAVFANRIESDEFVKLFQDRLSRFGLWKFAQTMTAVSEKYLGADHKQWAENPDLEGNYLEGVIMDILNGGNFGKKDMNRYREIKYISNRNERTVDNKGVVAQAFNTLNKKVYSDYAFIGRHRVFLPVGWIAEGGKYVGLLVTGKRKSKGTSAMLKEAAKRKDIYRKMELFEENEKFVS